MAQEISIKKVNLKDNINTIENGLLTIEKPQDAIPSILKFIEEKEKLGILVDKIKEPKNFITYAKKELNKVEEKIKSSILPLIETNEYVVVNHETGEIKNKTKNNLGKKVFIYIKGSKEKQIDKVKILENHKDYKEFIDYVPTINNDKLKIYIETNGIDSLPNNEIIKPASIGIQYTSIKKTLNNKVDFSVETKGGE